MKSTTKTGMLLRFNLRADWLKLVVWLTCICLLVIAVGFKFDTIYGSPAALKTITVTLKSTAMVALLGAFELPTDPSVAQVFGNEMLIFTALMVIAMNFAIGIAKTRGEEDQGITEMLRARAIGARSPLISAALELLLVNLALTTVLGLGLSAANIPGATATGNWLISVGMGLTGLTFGMFGLLAAQVTSNHTQTTIFSYMLLLVMYIIRMATDVKNADLTWWSPLGWVEKTQPYLLNNWWALLPVGVMGFLFFSCAGWLVTHRDLGTGLLATRPGRVQASPFLSSPLMLILRLNKTLMICWVVGSAVLGATYGSIFSSIGDVMKSNPTIQTVFGTSAVHAANHTVILNYSAIILMVIAAVATIPAVQLALSLRRDEKRGWLELIYAHPTSRTNVYLSTATAAVGAGMATYWAGVCGLILTGNSTLSSVSERLSATTFERSLVMGIPIIVVFCAVALLLVGLCPKVVSLTWFILGYGFITVYMGALLKLPAWAKQLTPFGWQPRIPVKPLDWTSFNLTVGLALILIAIGCWAYRRRDLSVD